MIVWLASYPKSGNTLLRSILSAYFYSEEGSFEFNNLYKISQFPAVHHFMRLGVNIDDDSEVFKNFINAQNLINEESKKAKFFKTHSRLCLGHHKHDLLPLRDRQRAHAMLLLLSLPTENISQHCSPRRLVVQRPAA